jgi:hypothetical protein
MSADVALLLSAARELERCLSNIPGFGNGHDWQFVGTIRQSEAASEAAV